jgi:ABC-type phosphate/phosphonate transport system ATPase subunit
MILFDVLSKTSLADTVRKTWNEKFKDNFGEFEQSNDFANIWSSHIQLNKVRARHPSFLQTLFDVFNNEESKEACEILEIVQLLIVKEYIEKVQIPHLSKFL